MTEDLMIRLCSTPEFVRCIGYDQNNPHHYLPLDLHMRAVMDNVEAMPGATDKLIVAALLHDIGKPDAAFFDEKKGATRFFGHAKRSAEIAFQLLTAEGFTKEYGAREMDRVITGKLKPLLMREILFGSLKKGGHVTIDGPLLHITSS